MKINVANESLSSVPRDPFKWLYTAQINKKILLKTFSFLFLSVFWMDFHVYNNLIMFFHFEDFPFYYFKEAI